MMTEMKLPACYAVIDENEMTYLDGGATIADSDAYKAFLNVGQVFNQLARIFSGASSIINNINVIYKSVVELNNLLGGFIKKHSAVKIAPCFPRRVLFLRSLRILCAIFKKYFLKPHCNAIFVMVLLHFVW